MNDKYSQESLTWWHNVKDNHKQSDCETKALQTIDQRELLLTFSFFLQSVSQ